MRRNSLHGVLVFSLVGLSATWACSGSSGPSASGGADGGREDDGAVGAAGACPRFSWVTRISSGGPDGPSMLAALDDGSFAVAGLTTADAVVGLGSANPVRIAAPSLDGPTGSLDAGASDGGPQLDGGDVDSGDASVGEPSVRPGARLAFVAKIGSDGAVVGATAIAADNRTNVSVRSIIPRLGGGAMLAVAVESRVNPSDIVAKVRLGTAPIMDVPVPATLRIELDAKGALVATERLASSANTRLAPLPNGGFAAAIGLDKDFDPTPGALGVVRYDIAGTEVGRTMFRPAASGYLTNPLLASESDGSLLIAAQCSEPIVADATGTPLPVACEDAVVARIGPSGTLGFASAFSLSTTEQITQIASDGREGAVLLTGQSTGISSGLHSLDAAGKINRRFGGADSAFSGVAFTRLGDDIVRVGSVGPVPARVNDTPFFVASPSVLIARSKPNTSDSWARLLGPGPGSTSAIVVSGDDVVLSGTFEKEAVFGADETARRLVALGQTDIFVARVAFGTDACAIPKPDAGLPNVPIPRVCADTNEEFQAAPKPNGSFDWNCDGVEERELGDFSHGCDFVSTQVCRGGGWQERVPGCGESGPADECGGPYCGASTDQKTQRCR